MTATERGIAALAGLITILGIYPIYDTYCKNHSRAAICDPTPAIAASDVRAPDLALPSLSALPRLVDMSCNMCRWNTIQPEVVSKGDGGTISYAQFRYDDGDLSAEDIKAVDALNQLIAIKVQDEIAFAVCPPDSDSADNGEQAHSKLIIRSEVGVREQGLVSMILTTTHTCLPLSKDKATRVVSINYDLESRREFKLRDLFTAEFAIGKYIGDLCKDAHVSGKQLCTSDDPFLIGRNVAKDGLQLFYGGPSADSEEERMNRLLRMFFNDGRSRTWLRPEIAARLFSGTSAQ